MGKSGGANTGGNRPYQSPPPQPPPAVPGPYSSRLQNGGATAAAVALTVAVARLKKLLSSALMGIILEPMLRTRTGGPRSTALSLNSPLPPRRRRKGEVWIMTCGMEIEAPELRSALI